MVPRRPINLFDIFEIFQYLFRHIHQIALRDAEYQGQTAGLSHQDRTRCRIAKSNPHAGDEDFSGGEIRSAGSIPAVSSVRPTEVMRLATRLPTSAEAMAPRYSEPSAFFTVKTMLSGSRRSKLISLMRESGAAAVIEYP